MKKSKIKFAIKQVIIESYSKAGYTNTADKFLQLFYKKLDSLYKTNK
jgi:ribosome-associated toxin RatA of RatAB toxin-antitoxin module